MRFSCPAVAAVALLSAQHAIACAVAPSEAILWDTENSQASADIVALVTVASSTQTQPAAARVELVVERIWKGQVGARWTFTQALDTSCDNPLLRNVRYVIFAKRLADGRVSVTGVADGAMGIVRDRLSAKVRPPPSLVTASVNSAPPKKKKR
ncbi:MAG TPA: hypothetical protein VFV69_20720 [Steroidobacteraceae bacterium]|nr:hypothetical protein [Steroidobacteraceae bacterium]